MSTFLFGWPFIYCTAHSIHERNFPLIFLISLLNSFSTISFNSPLNYFCLFFTDFLRTFDTLIASLPISFSVPVRLTLSRRKFFLYILILAVVAFVKTWIFHCCDVLGAKAHAPVKQAAATRERESPRLCLLFSSRQTEIICKFIGNLFSLSFKFPSSSQKGERFYPFVYSILTCFISAAVVNCGLKYFLLFDVDLRFRWCRWEIGFHWGKIFEELLFSNEVKLHFRVRSRFAIIDRLAL